ncbi:MAG: hypothetical protein WBW33_14710 [Bryobacteraceae bacterium]
MISILILLLAASAGCLALAATTDLLHVRPRWAGLLVVLGTGTLFGFGASSLLFTFVCAWLGQTVWILIGLEVAALGAVLVVISRKPIGGSEASPEPPSAAPLYPFILLTVLLLTLLLATTSFYSGWDSNPQGNWDAWSIWNLRAKFMAGDGGVAPRAWSPQLVETHPEYPLLLPGLVASAWKASGTVSPAAPIAAGYLFFLSLVSIATGGFTLLRGRTLGLLFGIVLMACPALLYEVATQYADVPLAAYFLGAVLLLLLGRPEIAGVMAALAAWTKQEGQLFFLIFLILLLVFKRAHALRALAGAVLPLLLVMLFQVFMAPHGATPALAHLADLSRYGTIGAAFFRQFWDLGAGWLHPILPVLVLGLVLRLDRRQYTSVLLGGLSLLGLLAGYFVVYLTSSNDLTWYLSTSLNRLFVQLWPLMLLTAFLALRRPEELATVETVAPGLSRAERRHPSKNKRNVAAS